MPKLNKLRKQKRYRYSVNKKTLRKKRTSTGKIKCPEVKEFWEHRKLPRKNFTEMGLSMNPNTTIPLPNSKQERLKIIKLANGFEEETIEAKIKNVPKEPKKKFVADKLEKEANAPRESGLRLPKGLVAQLVYFIEKYKFDYKGMVRDRKNYDQWTLKQFRAKIRTFRSIPQQFQEYLNKHNLTEEDINQWSECGSDAE